MPHGLESVMFSACFLTRGAYTLSHMFSMANNLGKVTYG